MKKFKIHYIKHGSCANYSFEETVFARSAKIALRKVYNYREFPKDKTRKQWMDYDGWANGITYSVDDPIEVKCD